METKTVTDEYLREFFPKELVGYRLQHGQESE
jgi:hypothetical protein